MSGITGSYDCSIFSFLRNLHTVLLSSSSFISFDWRILTRKKGQFPWVGQNKESECLWRWLGIVEVCLWVWWPLLLQGIAACMFNCWWPQGCASKGYKQTCFSVGDQSWVCYSVLLYQSCESHLLIHMPMEWIFPSQDSSVLHACKLSHVWLFSTTWTVAHQAPLSVELSRQEYWSGLPFLPPGDLPDPGVRPTHLLHLLYWQVGASLLSPLRSPNSVSGLPDFPFLLFQQK